jgi:hypothetical protein
MLSQWGEVLSLPIKGASTLLFDRRFLLSLSSS